MGFKMKEKPRDLIIRGTNIFQLLRYVCSLKE